MKRLAILTTAVFTTILAVLLLWQLRSIVLLFVLSLIVAALVRPPIQFLQERGLPRLLSILLTYLFIFGGLAALLYGIGIPLLNEVDRLVQNFAAFYRALDDVESSGNDFWFMLSTQMPTADQLDELLGSTAAFSLVQQLLGATQNFVGSVSQLLLAVVLSIYWTADRVRFERLWLSLLPPKYRIRGRSLWRRIEAAVGAYIASKIVQAVLAGGLLTAANLLIGVEYPFLLALLAVLAWLVPLVGGWLAVIVAFLLSIGNGLIFAGLTVACTLGILISVWLLMERRLYQYDRYGTVLVILILLIMVDALGFLGILIAPLVAITAQICLNELMEPKELTKSTDKSTGKSTEEEINLVELRQRLQEAQKMIEGKADPSPRTENLRKRLDSLLQEVETATYARTFKPKVEG